jgi:hypothetical protein
MLTNLPDRIPTLGILSSPDDPPPHPLPHSLPNTSGYLVLSIGDPSFAFDQRKPASWPLLHYWPTFPEFNSPTASPCYARLFQDTFRREFGANCELTVEDSSHTGFNLWKSTFGSRKGRFVLTILDLHLNFLNVRKYPGYISIVKSARVATNNFRIAASDALFKCSPGCLIVDSPEAGSAHLACKSIPAQKWPFIGFFSRAVDSQITPSPFHPLDVFSASLFDPLSVLYQWRARLRGLGCGRELNEIERKALKKLVFAVVRTIAWNLLDFKQFNDLFESDGLISQLFVGFMVASRILADINITPISIPEIPIVSRHVMWNVLENALDHFSVASEEIPLFSEWAFDQDFGVVKSGLSIQDFSFSISLCMVSAWSQKAVNVLAFCLDRQQESLQLALNVGVVPILLESLAREVNDYTLFCLIKLFVYDPSIIAVSEDVILRVAETQSLWSLIFTTLVMRESFVDEWISQKIMSLLDWTNQPTKVWTILCYAACRCLVPKGDECFDPLIENPCRPGLEKVATVTAIAELIRARCYLPSSVLVWVNDNVEPSDENLELQICCLFESYRLTYFNVDDYEAQSKIKSFMDRCIQMEESPVGELARSVQQGKIRPVGNSLYTYYFNLLRERYFCTGLSLDDLE